MQEATTTTIRYASQDEKGSDNAPLDSVKQIQKISERIKPWARYQGDQGFQKKYCKWNRKGEFYEIPDGVRTELILGFLSQLQPTEGWKQSDVTRLEPSLSGQPPNDMVEIKASTTQGRAYWGEEAVRISKGELTRLSETAKITTHPTLMPVQLYLKILNTPGVSSEIRTRESRTLEEILSKVGLLDEWKQIHTDLGFTSLDDFEEASQYPMLQLATQVCHTQEYHFFVEQSQREKDELAYNRIRKKVKLDEVTPNVLISIPGINFAYGRDKGEAARRMLRHEFGKVQKLIFNSMALMLEMAFECDCEVLSIPPLGLGVFLDTQCLSHEEQNTVARLYFEGFFEALARKHESYSNKLRCVYYNPGHYSNIFSEVQSKYNDSEISIYVQNYNKDSKLLPVACAKAGLRAGFVNASDADVLWGKNDVGEYYKRDTETYAIEEDAAVTSTIPIGSRGISPDAYYKHPTSVTADRHETSSSLSEEIKLETYSFNDFHEHCCRDLHPPGNWLFRRRDDSGQGNRKRGIDRFKSAYLMNFQSLVLQGGDADFRRLVEKIIDQGLRLYSMGKSKKPQAIFEGLTKAIQLIESESLVDNEEKNTSSYSKFDRLKVICKHVDDEQGRDLYDAIHIKRHTFFLNPGSPYSAKVIHSYIDNLDDKEGTSCCWFPRS